MDESFVITDLEFSRSIHGDNVSDIKTEEVKDDDALLFSQLEHLRTNVSGSFSSLQESADDGTSLEFPESLSNTDFGMLNESDFTNNFCKPEPLKMFCKSESIKIEGNPHFVKYKVLDGKHVRIWSCGICSKEFGHQYTLMRHLPTHTDERKFQCNTCGKAFRQMSTLSQHRAIHSSDRPYICEVCQKTFNRVSTLISHRKTHTGMKPHRCHLCNKAFHQKGNLRNHIFTHTNERPYKCDICEKGFNQMSNLMCHKLKAHQRADKPKYACSICGQDFSKRIALRNHEQHQHGLNQVLAPAAPPQAQEKLKYSNAIIVDPIKTDAMRLAMQFNQTPFALLRPLTGIPVLVRVLPAGDKQMLIPATADDLKKHGQISIISKVTETGLDNANIMNSGNKEGSAGFNSVGSTVQIRIPVVATVIQQSGRDGLSMSIVSPGPNGKIVNQQECTSRGNNSFIYTSTMTASGSDQGDPTLTKSINLEEMKENRDIYEQKQLVENAEIEFLDQTGSMISEGEFRPDFGMIPSVNIYSNNVNGISSSHCMQTLQEEDLSPDNCISIDELPNDDDDTTPFLLPWNF